MTSPLVERLAPVERTQILVVGAGPVGLFAALCAARAGLEVTLLEQNFRGCARGHATLLHPSSLRMLAELGLSRTLLQEGRSIDRVDLFMDGAPARSLELSTSALTITQSVFEELLLKELHSQDVEIRTPCEATTLTCTPDSVRAVVVRRELAAVGAGAHEGEWEPVETSLIDADFVIGADGYHSQVRASMGIDTSEVGATETFAMFEGPRDSTDSTLDLGFQGGLGSAAFPLPDQRARWGFQLGSDLCAPPDLDHLRKFLAERAAWNTAQPTEVEWSTVTHFERRVARHFGRGRVWLAGDAAHITSPFGGQSMNGGLTEVHELVERMAGCLRGGKALATLEHLGALHEREWQMLLGFRVQFEVPASAPPWLREQVSRIVPALPASGPDLRHLLHQLGVAVH